ncbi:FtsX-like permease family protein [Patulibacter defluvii]|uniref:FtsX-like permease family protein n=1 Tax=Patulibacter defluvii TaxID=3095358 RepID=UPI002A75E489|nr:FtsX-like permease family protein [Patulibacter sp. DM4]
MSGPDPDLDPLPARRRLRFSALLADYRDRLRIRWLQELLAIAGIAVGVALLYSSSVANTSLSGPVRQLSDGIVGNSQLQVVARGPRGLPVALGARLRKLPGVRIAAPILQVQANVVGPRGQAPVTIFGADPRVVQLKGSLLEGFTRGEAAQQETVALPGPISRRTGIRFGDDGRLQIGGRTTVVPMAVVDRSQIGRLTDNAIALSPIAYLQRLAGMEGRATRILIQADPERLDAVRRTLSENLPAGLDVRSTSHDADLFAVAAKPTSQATSIASVVSALVGWLFAICALLVTVEARARLARDRRIAGFRPGQVIALLAFDALVLGTVAVVAGLGLGELLSRSSEGSDVSFLGGAFPVGHTRVVTWTSVAFAVAGGYLAAFVGVLAPVWRVLLAHRLHDPSLPTDGRRRRSRAGVVPAAGLALLLTSVAVTIAAPSAAVVALVALVGALLLLTPGLLWLVTLVLDRVSARSRIALRALEMAMPQLREPAWHARSLAIATTGAVAVFGGVALQGSRGNLQAGLDGVSHELDLIADVWVAPQGAGDLFATIPFAPGLERRIAAVPGVATVTEHRSGLLDVGAGRAWVIAPPRSTPDPIPGGQVREGDLRQADARVRAGGWATLSRALADDLGVDVGDSFVLPAPRPTRLRVAAITTNFGWTGGAIVIRGEDFARAWASPAIGAYLVQTAPGTSPAVVRDRIRQRLGPRSALRVETVPERWERQKRASRGGLAQLSQIATLTLVAAVLAMAAAMAGLLWQRRRLVARAKFHGHRTATLWRALAVESGILFGTGCLAGAAAGVFGQVLLSRGLEVISGFPVIVSVRAGVAALGFVAVTVVAMLVVAVPGLFVARSQPSASGDD